MPADRLVALAAGVALLIAALAWRALVRRRAIARLHEALRDGDPDCRRAAVSACTEGIARHARALLAVAQIEDDEGVIDALVDAVARSQWVPAGSPALNELRLWAGRRPATAALTPVESAPDLAPEPESIEFASVDPIEAFAARLDEILGEHAATIRIQTGALDVTITRTAPTPALAVVPDRAVPDQQEQQWA